MSYTKWEFLFRESYQGGEMIDIFGGNTGYYFYSSVFQGNMALLALIGVFAVYKLQQVSNSLKSNNDRLFIYINDNLINPTPMFSYLREYVYTNMNKLIAEIDNIEQKIPNISKYNIESLKESTGRFKKLSTYITLVKEYECLTKNHESILKTMLKPFCWILVVIIISLILLPLANLLHNQYGWYEIIPISILIILNIIALILNSLYIFKTLKLSEKSSEPSINKTGAP